jgi:hypothetical protein
MFLMCETSKNKSTLKPLLCRNQARRATARRKRVCAPPFPAGVIVETKETLIHLLTNKYKHRLTKCVNNFYLSFLDVRTRKQNKIMSQELHLTAGQIALFENQVTDYLKTQRAFYVNFARASYARTNWQRGFTFLEFVLDENGNLKPYCLEYYTDALAIEITNGCKDRPLCARLLRQYHPAHSALMIIVFPDYSDLRIITNEALLN